MIKLLLLLDFIFLIYLLLEKNENSKMFKFGIIIFFIVLFSISITFVPANTFDISVYYKEMDIFRNYGIVDGFIKSQYNDYPVICLYFALCSFFPNFFLSGLSTIVIYGIVVFLLTKCKFKSNFDYLLIIFFVLVSINYLSTINGIRNAMCYAILSLAIYWFNERNMGRAVFFGLISVGIHSSAILVIVMFIFGKIMSIKFFTFAFLVILFLKILPNTLLPLETIPILGALFFRIRVYLLESISINSVLIYYFTSLLMGIFIYSVYKKKESLTSYSFFTGILFTFPIFFLFDNTIIARVIGFIPFYNLALSNTFVAKRKINKCINYLVYVYLFISFLFLCYTTYSVMSFGGTL
ncbi:MAG: EpsG family protein [Bacilli bacterium]